MKRLIKSSLLIALLLGLGLMSLTAKPDLEAIKKNLPELIGVSNIGTDFWFTIPPPLYNEYSNSDNNIYIFVSTIYGSDVFVETIDKIQSKQSKPYITTEFRLNPNDALPYSKSGLSPEAKEFVAWKKGIHVYSKSPMAVYVLLDYSGSSEGFMAYPVSALGNKYVISSYPDGSDIYPYIKSLPSISGVVAAYDNTKVKFTVGGNKSSVTAAGRKPGETAEEILNKGDVWMLSSGSDGSDLSGSLIESNYPVALVSGNQCANIPVSTPKCAYIAEMQLPTSAWGKQFPIAGISDRKFSSVLRIYAKEPNTKIYRDGTLIGTVNGPCGIIDEAYIETRITSDSLPGISVITSDKPVQISLFNPGIGEDGDPKPTSGPLMFEILPTEQYKKEAFFYTPGINSKIGLTNNYLMLIYEAEGNGQPPDDMEIAKAVEGPLNWTKVKYLEQQKAPAIFNTIINGKKYAAKLISINDEGVYRIRSGSPFGAYCYGYSPYLSYGYPASAALKNLEYMDTLAPVPVWNVKCDGNVEGVIRDMPEDPSSRSNLSTIFFYEDKSYNYIFENDPYSVQGTQSINWKLKIINPGEDALGIIRFTDRAGNDTLIAVEYFAPKIAAEPPILDFGKMVKGESKDLFVKIINKSSTGHFQLSRLKIKSNTPGYSISSVPLPYRIAPLSEVVITVNFTATDDGVFSDSLMIGDTCIFSPKVVLTAETGGPEINVTDVQFGDLTAGKISRDSIFISNSGRSDLIITGYSGPMQPCYTLLFPDGISISQDKPLILKPGDRPFKIEILFNPQSTSQFNDNVIFFSNARKIDSVAIISGRGVKAGLVSNSLDFGRRRIWREKHPSGPYTLENQTGIRLENSGILDVTITGFQIEKSINGEAFIFDSLDFLDKTIVPGKYIDIPVKFFPKSIGTHELVISYTNTEGSTTNTSFKGIGVLPRIKTSDVDFDTTVVWDTRDFNIRRIRVVNLPASEWEWCDSVRIFDLVPVAVGAISDSWDEFGTEGFKYDKKLLPLSTFIPPGGTLEFDAAFSASKPGIVNVPVQILSDAETDLTSNWKGFGTAKGLRFLSDSSRICLGEKDTLVCSIENYGSSDAIINTIRLEPPSTDYTIIEPNPQENLVIASNNNLPVKIVFQPTVNYRRAIDLIAETSGFTENILSTKLTLESVLIQRNSSISPVSQTVKIGDEVNYTISIEPGDDLEMAGITSFEIELKFDPHFIEILPDKFKLGELINGRFIIEGKPEIDLSSGIARVMIRSLEGHLNGSGELLKFSLRAYMPPEINQSTTITHNIIPRGTKCSQFNPRNSLLIIKQFCMGDHNQVVLSGNRYNLMDINPNPVSSDKVSIDYSVALDGWTEIILCNSSGEKVCNIREGYLRQGNYSSQVRFENIPSGLYFCRMVSGPYSSVKAFMIVK